MAEERQPIAHMHPPTSKPSTGRENGPSIMSVQSGGRSRRPRVGLAADAPSPHDEYRQTHAGEAEDQQGQQRCGRAVARTIADGAGGSECHGRTFATARRGARARGSARARRARRCPTDDVVGHAGGADDQGSTAIGGVVALVDLDAEGRGHRAGRSAGRRSDQAPAVRRAIALDDRRAGDCRREGVTDNLDATAAGRTDALVHRGGRRTGADAVEVARDHDAAPERSAPAVDRVIALGDRGDWLGQDGRRVRASRTRGARGTVALVDGDRSGSAGGGDRVDDGDLADQAKAGRVVDTVAARGGRGDRRSSRWQGSHEGCGHQERESDQAPEEGGERTMHGHARHGRGSWGDHGPADPIDCHCYIPSSMRIAAHRIPPPDDLRHYYTSDSRPDLAPAARMITHLIGYRRRETAGTSWSRPGRLRSRASAAVAWRMATSPLTAASRLRLTWLRPE